MYTVLQFLTVDSTTRHFYIHEYIKDQTLKLDEAKCVLQMPLE